MSSELYKLLAARESGRIKILIHTTKTATQEVLSELRRYGVCVTRYIGDKIWGAIKPEILEGLRNHRLVKEVETRTTLSPAEKRSAR